MQLRPRAKISETRPAGDRLTRGKEAIDLQPGAADRLKAEIVGKAVYLGLSGDRMAERLETGAANAWEGHDRVRSDLLALSRRRRADLRNPDQSRKVIDELEGFYHAAVKLIDPARTHEVVPDNDRLLRALGSIGRIMQADALECAPALDGSRLTSARPSVSVPPATWSLRAASFAASATR